MIAVSNLKLRPGEPEDRLRDLAAKALRINPKQIRALKIRKKSLDARKKDDLKWIYTVAVAVDGNESALLRRCKTASAETPYHYDIPSIAPPNRMVRPLPTPETRPPKSAHSSRSVPASGETKFTSIGNTCMIR